MVYFFFLLVSRMQSWWLTFYVDRFPFLDVDSFPFLDADIVADCSVMPRDFLFFDWDVVGSSLRA